MTTATVDEDIEAKNTRISFSPYIHMAVKHGQWSLREQSEVEELEESLNPLSKSSTLNQRCLPEKR